MSPHMSKIQKQMAKVITVSVFAPIEKLRTARSSCVYFYDHEYEAQKTKKLYYCGLSSSARPILTSRNVGTCLSEGDTLLVMWELPY